MERLIGARLVYRQPSMSRLVSFEYLNRQLVWQELSEFMLFLLPLINVTKVGVMYQVAIDMLCPYRGMGIHHSTGCLNAATAAPPHLQEASKQC